MMRIRAAILALGLVLLPAAAAGEIVPQPAELPPLGYGGEVYVDSAGCAFLRVLVGGEVIWAPRYRADGTRACGLAPSFAGGGAAARSAEPREAPVTPPDSEAAAQSAPEETDDGGVRSGQPGVAPGSPSESDAVAGTAPSGTNGGAESDAADTAGPAPGIYIQAGAFNLPENASRVRDMFEAQGWGGGTRIEGPFTVVYAGPFADDDDAREALGQIRREGMPDAYVYVQD